MRLTTPEISWHGKEPLFSLDFSFTQRSNRLATSGADSNIRIWAVQADDDNGSKVEFIANLSRHTKAVNVVRFSPQGNMLASGGDDYYVIIWKLNDDKDAEGFSQLPSLNSADVENKETWQVTKMLRGHVEDVYDLAWSPNTSQLISGSVDNSVIIWDTNKGDKLKILKDHRQYVQGVCWDPCGNYVASYSCDRTCRIYNTSHYRCCYNINKMTVPSKPKSENQNSKQIKIFHDETMPSFFRRLTFSPDGLLLLVPGGKFEANQKTVNTTYVFTKSSMNKPVLYFPATKKATVAVRCCPVLFELRDKDSGEAKKSVFKLPYRMVIAVASLDSVVLYDTQQALPFGFLSNMHYASLTDIAWSSDGRVLAISSRDGYCSLVTFDGQELGVPYSQTATEVIENSAIQSSSLRALTPISKSPDPAKDERTPPKIEKLSIKNFVTVNPSKSSPDPTSSGLGKNHLNQDGDHRRTEPVPRRVGFLTVHTSTGMKPEVKQHSSHANPTSSVINPGSMATASVSTQARRVNFTTPQPGQSSSLVQGQPNTQSLNGKNSKQTNRKATTEEKKPDVPQQSRRVGFVTLKPSQSTTTQDSSAKNHIQASNVCSNVSNTTLTSGEEVRPKTTASVQHTRRVGFVTIQPAPHRSPTNDTSTAHQNALNQNKLGASHEGCTSTIKHPLHQTNFVTIQPPQALSGSKRDDEPPQTVPNISQDNANVTNVQSSVGRQDKPPIPLEPQVIIINE